MKMVVMFPFDLMLYANSVRSITPIILSFNTKDWLPLLDAVINVSNLRLMVLNSDLNPCIVSIMHLMEWLM